MASYKNCRRNHAASLGAYGYDGCLEFLADESVDAPPFQCVVCGCHRSFHRKVEDVVPFSALLAQERFGRRRPRTKFTAEQKKRMEEFAEKIGWKLQRIKRGDDDEVARFCQEIGVNRRVFMSWVHNHKNSSSSLAANGADVDATDDGDGDDSASPSAAN